jgi:hypothetical protein
MTAPTLTDGVVVLDGFKAADADAHLAGEDDEHARRFGWYPNRSTPGTVGAAIDRWRAEWEQGGRTRAFAARLDGVLVGGCELRLVSPASAELSYWTFPPFRRRGLATRAVRLVVAWATAAARRRRVRAARRARQHGLASRRRGGRVPRRGDGRRRPALRPASRPGAGPARGWFVTLPRRCLPPDPVIRNASVTVPGTGRPPRHSVFTAAPVDVRDAAVTVPATDRGAGDAAATAAACGRLVTLPRRCLPPTVRRLRRAARE